MASSRRPAKMRKLPCGRPLTAGANGPIEFSAEERASVARLLEDHQKRKGLNRSEVRDQLLEAILQCEGHFTGPELIQKVHALYPSMGAATIYRNLPIFIEAGVLRESLNDKDGQVIYELQGAGHHDHIVCLDCQTILEFHEDRIENLQQEVIEQLGFTEVHHRHVVYARCEYKKKTHGVTKGTRLSYTSSVPSAV